MKSGQPSWIGELNVDVTEVRIAKCPNSSLFGLTVLLNEKLDFPRIYDMVKIVETYKYISLYDGICQNFHYD